MNSVRNGIIAAVSLARCGRESGKTMKPVNARIALAVLAAMLGLVSGLTTAPALAHCPHNGSFEHKHCDTTGGSDGSSGAVTLEITFEFGEFDGSCTPPDCVNSTITAEGDISCGNAICDFNSTHIDRTDPLGLPGRLKDLLDHTEWRGTPLDPDECFGTGGPSYTGQADVTKVFLRRSADPASGWHAEITADALDTLGLTPRRYGFVFEGTCDLDNGCDALPPDSQSTFAEGELIRIDGKGPDKKFDGTTPCRCTRSNTPDCPDDVVDEFGDPIPAPPISITVNDVTPAP